MARIPQFYRMNPNGRFIPGGKDKDSEGYGPEDYGLPSNWRWSPIIGWQPPPPKPPPPPPLTPEEIKRFEEYIFMHYYFDWNKVPKFNDTQIFKSHTDLLALNLNRDGKLEMKNWTFPDINEFTSTVTRTIDQPAVEQSIESARIQMECLSAELPDLEKMQSQFTELQRSIGQLAQKDVETLNEALKDNKISTTEWDAEVASLIEKYGEFPNIVSGLEELRGTQGEIKQDVIDLNELTSKWEKDFQNGIADAIIKGKDFGDVLSNIGAEMANIALKTMLSGDGGIGSFLNSIFGLLKSAKGNVFSGGHVIPYAKGGIVSRPTIFPMANGIGLMGEAGAEAVMPLARDAHGRLGVRAGGANASDVIFNVENRTATPVQANQVGLKYDDMNNIVVGIVLEDQATKGPIARNYRR